MYETCCRDHFATECLGDGLMAQAYAQNRDLFEKPVNDRQGDSRRIRAAGARRYYDAGWLHDGKGIDANGVVSKHPDIRNQLSEILNQVVGE